VYGSAKDSDPVLEPTVRTVQRQPSPSTAVVISDVEDMETASPKAKGERKVMGQAKKASPERKLLFGLASRAMKTLRELKALLE
jgi:glutamine synthetase